MSSSVCRTLELFGCRIVAGATCGLLLTIGLAACGSKTAGPSTTPAKQTGERPQFAFYDPQGGAVSHEMLRGRATVLVFGTTYSLPSQAVAERVRDLLASHTPRINAAMIVLEPPKHAVFVATFRESLELNFPVLMADQGTLMGEGPLGTIDLVPTVFILDASGKITWKGAGAVSLAEMERQLELAQ